MLQLNEFRNIILSNMPYDTGYMNLAGARFFETNNFLLCKYDIDTVPYIVFQEEGFIHWKSGEMITVNQGFIREKTVGDLIRNASFKQSGQRASPSTLDERIKRRGSTNVIKQGAMDKIKGEYRYYENII